MMASAVGRKSVLYLPLKKKCFYFQSSKIKSTNVASHRTIATARSVFFFGQSEAIQAK